MINAEDIQINMEDYFTVVGVILASLGTVWVIKKVIGLFNKS